MLRSLKMKKIRTVRQIKRLWQQRAFSEPWFRGMKHLKPLSIFVQKMFWCTQVNPQVKRSRLGWEHVKSLYSCTLKIVISVFCMWLCPSSPGLWLQVPPSSSCSAPEKNTCIGIRNSVFRLEDFLQLCFVCFCLLTLLPASILVQFFGMLLIFPFGTQIRGVPHLCIQKVTESSDLKLCFNKSIIVSIRCSLPCN